MSTNSIESGKALGTSSVPKPAKRRTVDDLKRRNAKSMRRICFVGAGILATSVGGVIEDSMGNPVSGWITKHVHSALRAVTADTKYITIDEGTPKESIKLASMDIGEGLRCEGTVIFNSIGKSSVRGDEYCPALVLTISGLPPHPNGVECRINLHCGSGWAPAVEGKPRERIVKTSMTGFGGKVDPETREALFARLGSHAIPNEDGAARLDSLVHGRLAEYEALARIGDEDLAKLYDAVFANATLTSEEPEEEPRFAFMQH